MLSNDERNVINLLDEEEMSAEQKGLRYGEQVSVNYNTDKMSVEHKEAVEFDQGGLGYSQLRTLKFLRNDCFRTSAISAAKDALVLKLFEITELDPKNLQEEISQIQCDKFKEFLMNEKVLGHIPAKVVLAQYFDKVNMNQKPYTIVNNFLKQSLGLELKTVKNDQGKIKRKDVKINGKIKKVSFYQVRQNSKDTVEKFYAWAFERKSQNSINIEYIHDADLLLDTYL